jgi:ribosomal protein S1
VVIIKYNRHGALASIEEGIAGLVHVSEFETELKLRETLELGKSYSFIITLFDSKEQRMALSYKKYKEKRKYIKTLCNTQGFYVLSFL